MTSEITRFEVQDEGPGISAEDQLKLFTKFTKIGTKTTGGEDSSGLGLNIVKKFIDAMNGHVGVESTVGKGATFYFELPTADAQTPRRTGSRERLDAETHREQRTQSM
jgi:signal transduction histidine kinase